MKRQVRKKLRCALRHALYRLATERSPLWSRCSDLERALQDAARQTPDILVYQRGPDQREGVRQAEFGHQRHLPPLWPAKRYFTMGNHKSLWTLQGSDFNGMTLRDSDSCTVPACPTSTLKCAVSGCRSCSYRPNGINQIERTPACQTRQRLTGWSSGSSTHRLAPVTVWFHQPVNDTVADSTDTCMESDESAPSSASVRAYCSSSGTPTAVSTAKNSSCTRMARCRRRWLRIRRHAPSIVVGQQIW